MVEECKIQKLINKAVVFAASDCCEEGALDKALNEFSLAEAMEAQEELNTLRQQLAEAQEKINVAYEMANILLAAMVSFSSIKRLPSFEKWTDSWSGGVEQDPHGIHHLYELSDKVIGKWFAIIQPTEKKNDNSSCYNA